MAQFRTSELRMLDSAGVYSLIGVMTVSRKMGSFRPNLGYESYADEWKERIDYCLGQGTDLYEFLDYLFTRTSGVLSSWSRPESVRGRDLDDASMKALLLARARDEVLPSSPPK